MIWLPNMIIIKIESTFYLFMYFYFFFQTCIFSSFNCFFLFSFFWQISSFNQRPTFYNEGLMELPITQQNLVLIRMKVLSGLIRFLFGWLKLTPRCNFCLDFFSYLSFLECNVLFLNNRVRTKKMKLKKIRQNGYTLSATITLVYS